MFPYTQRYTQCRPLLGLSCIIFYILQSWIFIPRHSFTFSDILANTIGVFVFLSSFFRFFWFFECVSVFFCDFSCTPALPPDILWHSSNSSRSPVHHAAPCSSRHAHAYLCVLYVYSCVILHNFDVFHLIPLFLVVLLFPLDRPIEIYLEHGAIFLN